MNHHADYKEWCLALWIIRDYPAQARKENPSLKHLKDSLLRRSWIVEYERKHGKTAGSRLRNAAFEIHRTIARGEVPEYNGPYQEAQRGIQNDHD